MVIPLAFLLCTYPERLFGAAMLPMQSIEGAVQETRYAAKELGFRCGFIRPNPYNGRVLYAPEYDEGWVSTHPTQLTQRNSSKHAPRPAIGTQNSPSEAGIAGTSTVQSTPFLMSPWRNVQLPLRANSSTGPRGG